MQEHQATCSDLKKNMAMLRKFGELIKNAAESEEDKHSSSDEDQEEQHSQDQIEYDERCQECKKRISDHASEWWCDCGYGLCADCQPGLSLNHVCGCPAVRKGASSKRINKKK
jgi:hypothetical protein